MNLLGLKKIFVFLILFLGFYSATNAQSSNTLDLSLSNENPAPGQSITVTARGYSIDLMAANIKWTVNGNVVREGIGETTYTLNAPSAGKKTTIQVQATSINGARVSGSISIGSGSVDMLLETDGFVPPFFKGKLPIVYQNKVKIIAIPHLTRADGTEYDPKTLVYTWRSSAKVLEEESGYGKQTLTVVGDIIPRETNVNVTVSNREGTNSTSGNVGISFSDPSISFYVDDPTYGPMYNKLVSNVLRIGSEREVGLAAVPFGFSGKWDKMQFNWVINGEQQPVLASSRSIVLRAPSDGNPGQSSIKLTINNMTNILQQSVNGLMAMYGAVSKEEVQF